MSQTSNSVPTHLGIILDGNRRWAEQNSLSVLEGHKRGYQNLKTISRAARSRGVKYLSAYVFSTENWNRSQEEVGYLMDLLRWVVDNEVEEMHREGVKVRFLGSEARLDPQLLKKIRAAEAKTAANTAGTLGLCLNYGGQTEIVEAVRAIGGGEITIESISRHLYAPEMPPLDLIIRTSGEHRLSNFMLWRSAYSELYFTDKHWPAFTEADLDEALADYAGRERRLGK